MWIKPAFLSGEEVGKVIMVVEPCGEDVGVYCPPDTNWECSNCPDYEYQYSTDND